LPVFLNAATRRRPSGHAAKWGNAAIFNGFDHRLTAEPASSFVCNSPDVGLLASLIRQLPPQLKPDEICARPYMQSHRYDGVTAEFLPLSVRSSFSDLKNHGFDEF